jgi:hypothetical protein
MGVNFLYPQPSDITLTERRTDRTELENETLSAWLKHRKINNASADYNLEYEGVFLL